MKKLSLIVNVLESYPVVRRQLLHLGRILTPECELILVDDGSIPSLRETCESVPRPFDFVFHETRDYRPWTQPRARNIGAKLARAPRLVFFDIDHILTQEILSLCLNYEGDKLHWRRRPGILDEQGHLVTERQVLLKHGLKEESPSVHANSFMIRRELFERLGGYDERFCGRYGGDDIDFNTRYEALCNAGLARLPETLGDGYYYPDPAFLKEQFHSLVRQVAPEPAPLPPRPRTHYRMRSAPAAGATEETYTIQLRKGSAQVRFATRGLVDRSIVDQIWVRDTYGVRATSRPPGLVVDIGAHIGAFTIMAAKAWPDARIVAAEADPENAALLRSNLSGCRNVEIVEAVIVGDNLKDVQFHRVVDKTNHNSGGGSCKRDEPGSEPVRLPAMSAVELWQSRQLTRCGLFKLDCEGAEVDVLRELADEGLLHGVEHIVGEWHSDVPTEPSRETTKAQLKRILRATHHLAFLPHGTGREGHFFATLRTISDVGTSSPADSGSTAGDNAAQ